MTKTACPGVIPPAASTACRAVPAETGTTAACSYDRFPGLRASLFSRATAYSANVPLPKPNTSSPTANRGTAGAPPAEKPGDVEPQHRVLRPRDAEREPAQVRQAGHHVPGAP